MVCTQLLCSEEAAGQPLVLQGQPVRQCRIDRCQPSLLAIFAATTALCGRRGGGRRRGPEPLNGLQQQLTVAERPDAKLVLQESWQMKVSSLESACMVSAKARQVRLPFICVTTADIASKWSALGATTKVAGCAVAAQSCIEPDASCHEHHDGMTDNKTAVSMAALCIPSIDRCQGTAAGCHARHDARTCACTGPCRWRRSSQPPANAEMWYQRQMGST